MVSEREIEAAAIALRPHAFRELSAFDFQSDDYALTNQEKAQESARKSARAALSAAALARAEANSGGPVGAALRTLLERNAALERERDAWRKECEKLSTVWAENHSRNKRAEEAEARVKELEALMRKAHAVMRECGWQLAISAEPQGDGILEAACTEIEADFADALSARALKENGNG